jgi:hypothetical protein
MQHQTQSNQMEGNTHHWIFPEDVLLLDQNASEQKEIVHVSWKL